MTPLFWLFPSWTHVFEKAIVPGLLSLNSLNRDTSRRQGLLFFVQKLGKWRIL